MESDEMLSLFSLEVAVESMRINSSSISCRFPAVAFRLLDFPTLILNHIESVEAGKIKESVFIDQVQEVNGIPPQLQELKDHRGNFVFKKGKSCMFKMNIDALQMHLNNTPLYVMVVDTWPDIPKLVANCTVSLQEVIRNICADIQKCGIEVPAVHSVRGSYKLCNLMGSEIGWVVLGLRLLSLGSSLMAHIPQTSLVMRKSVENKLESNSKREMVSPSVHNANSLDDLVDKLENHAHESTHHSTSKPKITFAATTTDTAMHIPFKHSGTQTASSRKKHSNTDKVLRFSPSISQNNGQESDLIISNTHCPPPLYFNAELVVNDGEASHDRHVNIQTREFDEFEMNASLPSSDTMSICSMEQYTETHVKFQSAACGEKRSTMSVRKTQKKQSSRSPGQIKSSPRTPRTLQTEESMQRQGSRLNLANHNEMPILRALLQELSLLHGNVLPNGPSIQSQEPPKPMTVTDPECHDTSRKRDAMQKDRDIFVQEQQSPYRHKHEDCTKTPRGVPPAKSWLRKEPKKSMAKKTKLRYGMTNTQKLRLQKNNPDLLKQLEAQEHKIQTYKQSIAEKVQKKKAAEVELRRNAASNLEISTEIHHYHNQEDNEADHSNLMQLPQSHASGDKTEAYMDPPVETNANIALRINLQDVSDDSDGQSQLVGLKKRKPVPTPRMNKGATFKLNDVDIRQKDVDIRQKDEYAKSDVMKKDWNNPQDKVSDVFSSSEKSVKSGRSIDVYLPTPMMEDSYTDGDNTHSSVQSPVKLPPKAITIPGFTSLESSSQDEDAERKTSLRYSDDFDNSRNSTGEELRYLSRSVSESDHSEAAKSRLDSSYESHAKQSVTSHQSKLSDIPQNIHQSHAVNKHQQMTRLQPGLAMPKPLVSTRSPVPLVGKRQVSRPTIIQVQPAQPSIDTSDEEDVVKMKSPTPKPRTNLQQTGSTLSTTASRPLDNFSSSDFGTNDSGRYVGGFDVTDKSAEDYSDEEFESSDGSAND